MVYVRLADQSTRGVPAWMFDPAVCAGVQLADKPLIEAVAFIELCDLLEQQWSNARIGGHGHTRKEPCEETTCEG
jgi:hypothetical protein